MSRNKARPFDLVSGPGIVVAVGKTPVCTLTLMDLGIRRLYHAAKRERHALCRLYQYTVQFLLMILRVCLGFISMLPKTSSTKDSPSLKLWLKHKPEDLSSKFVQAKLRSSTLAERARSCKSQALYLKLALFMRMDRMKRLKG